MKALQKLPVFLQVLIGAVLLVIGALLLVPEQLTPNHYTQEELPWNSTVDSQGHVHALGLITHTSTLADAMRRYGKDVEVKLFADQALNPTTVEAYFPAIYLGSIKSPMILRLEVPYARKQALMQEAPGVRATPTGEKEVLLTDFQARSLLNAPIETITLVGRDLPKEALIKRFGQPTLIKKSPEDNTEHWLYPQKGLRIIVDPEGKELFEWAELFTQLPQ